MGMRIQGTHASNGVSGTNDIDSWRQRQQGLKDLLGALQSGDLGAAQKAYATATNGRTPPADSPLAKLGAALQTGDISAARTAADAWQAARAGHHHHGDNLASAASAASAASPVGGTGSLINLTA